MRPTVRPARAEDAHPIAEVHVAAWRAVYRGHMPDALLDGLCVEQRADVRRRAIADPATPEHRTFVLDAGGRVVGFSVTGPTRDPGQDPARVAEVYAVYLAPERWGRGDGRVLFAATVEDLRERDYRAVTLWVLDGNARARRFYEHAGLRHDGASKVESFGGAPLAEVRYRLDLLPARRASDSPR
jgi:GNAT superfamily N-acetyltransferase